MKTIVVNAVGEQCPIPVVKATRALREMTEPGLLEVHVDNEIAVQNLTRMAAGHKLAARSEKLGEKEFVVTMEVTDPAGETPLEEPPLVCAPDQRGNLVVAVDSAVMGRGSDELGKALMKGFLFAVSQLPELPRNLVWEQLADTWEAGQSAVDVPGGRFSIGPRSVKVFAARPR